MVFTGLSLISVGFLLLRGVEVDSAYWAVAWPLLVMSFGIGLLTAPTTSAIMNTVLDDKQGVASAVNDTTREVGAALGIALAGSLLAAQYTSALEPRLATLPAQTRDAAVGSLGQALEVARHMGPGGAELADQSKAAFVEAMHTSLLALAITVGIGAVVIGLWAPGRDDEQLRVIRRIRLR